MLKRIITIIGIFILVYGAYHVHAQNIDSLKGQLTHATGDNSKAKLLIMIGRGYSHNGNVDSGRRYLQMSVSISKHLDDDSLCMRSFNEFGNMYALDSRFDEAGRYFDTAIIYARRLNYTSEVFGLLTDKAGILNQTGRYYASLDIGKEAIEMLDETSIPRSYVARMYTEMSVSYSHIGQEVNALDVLQKSSHIYDSLNNLEGVANNYMSIFIMYANKNRFTEALKYASIMDSLYEKTGDVRQRSILKTNLGILYKSMGQYDRAIRIFNDRLKTAIDSQDQMFIYLSLGETQSLKGDFIDARASLVRAMYIAQAYKDAQEEMETSSALAEAYEKVGKFDSALKYALYAEQLCDENHLNLNGKKVVLQTIFRIYEAKNDMTNAVQYHLRFENVQDSLFEEMQTGLQAEAETRFGVAEKDKELTKLSMANELQKVKSQRQLIALLLSGLIVVIIVIVYRRSLHKNALLSEQKRALESQQSKLVQQKKVIDDQLLQLEAAATMKSKFFASISHELRTPVTLLTGMLELMSKKNTDDAKENERLNVAYNNSRKLQHMVEEILDLTKLENNVSEPVYETKEIAPLLKRIVYTFETLVEKEDLTLQYDDAAATGLYASLDSLKFEKVINNLIYNAIKFNRKNGFIKVIAYSSADKNQLCVAVSDSGIGITKEDLPHIFDHYYQGDTSELKAAGAGIGLSLVKEFTEIMGGSVDVQSAQGKGTTFILKFPLVTPEVVSMEGGDDLAPLQVEHWGNFDKRQTVLVVEDNREMRYYLKEILGEKVNIAMASDGAEGLVWLDQNIPDLIISDVMMPGMDGKEFVNRIKADTRYKKIPIITLTALADMENQLSFLRMGIDDYIVKPFNVDELRIRVYNLLANNAERKIFNEQPVEPGDIIPDSREADEFREKITAYVSARLKNDQISVYELALELGLSERQLYRHAKSITGCTPAQLIKEVRLQKAYELLIAGKVYKIEDLANRVGFENISYFSRQFLERFGKRPTEFL